MINSDGSWMSGFTSAVLLILLPLQANAQEFDSNAVHWAYSSYFGTGWYRIGEHGDAFVIRVTPRLPLREATTEDGEKQVGVEFRLPLTIGLDTFSLDDPSGSLDPGNLATLSITPGVDVTIPINDRWTLKPYATFGFGTVLGESESAWTYWAGINSKFALHTGKHDWYLLNSFGYVGYTPINGHGAEDVWPVMVGLEYEHPLGNMKVAGGQALLTWHGLYTSFENDLDAVLEDGSSRPIQDQWEFGLAIRGENERIRFWIFHFDRLGLAYRFSSNNEFKGIAVIFRSVFDN